MSEHVPDWVPGWVDTVDCACWICDPTGRLVYMNDEAGQLLGVTEAALGNWCHETVASRDADGEEFCRAGCPPWCDAMLDRPPQRRQLITRGADGQDHLSRTRVVPLTGPHDTYPWLVHCAYSQEQSSRVESLLTRVAAEQHTPSEPTSRPPTA